MKRIFRIFVLVLMLVLPVQVGMAAVAKKATEAKVSAKVERIEEATAQQGETGNSEELDFKKVSRQLTEIETYLKDENFTRQSLEEYAEYMNDTELKIEAAIRKLEKELAYAQESLAAFGEENAETVESDKAIVEMREKYSTAVTGYKNKLIEVNLLKAEVTRLNALVSEMRGQILIGNLVAEKNVLIVPKTFFKSIADAAVFFWNVCRSPVDWYIGLSEEQRHNLYAKGWYVFLILGLALSFGLLVRGYIIRHWGYRRTEDQPRYWQKVVVAIVTALAYGVIPSLLIGGCLAWEMTNADLFETRFGRVLSGAFFQALVITLTCAVARVVLAPWNGRWRLFNITDQRAERVFKSMTLSIILLGVCAYLLHIARFFEPTDELMLLLRVSFDAVKACVIILVAVSVFGEIKNKAEDDTDKAAESAAEGGNGANDENEGTNVGIRVILFATIFSLLTFSVSLFGYPDLASFIFNRFFATVFLIGMFVVVRRIVWDVLCRGIVFWVRTFRMRKRFLSKVDFLMSLLITPVLVLCLIYMLLRIWGVSSSFMTYGIKKLIFGFKVGGINISLIAILTGLVVFVVSLTLVRMFKRRLSENLLTRINMDEGIKHSLVSGVSFIGFIISVILAISAMGVDLSNLAVIAGALSVGIGFGLQDIIKNLVSGIIILFERPFKVGDWVILGGEEGKIKQINIRSTELETWTKRSVIIPNATLISSSLVNLTHGDNWQRQSIFVGVSYDADVEKVTALLIECARSNKRVTKVPAPVVLFKDFGSSSLDFELRFHVTDVRTDYVASSEVRYTILRRFREEGIEIAYPQLDIHNR